MRSLLILLLFPALAACDRSEDKPVAPEQNSTVSVSALPVL
jgi:hypothetical protein